MALKFIDTINKLDFTNEERTSLFSYFYKNSIETDKVIPYLDNCRNDNEKINFLKKTFLSDEHQDLDLNIILEHMRKIDNELYISTRDMLKAEPAFLIRRENLLAYLQQPLPIVISIHPMNYNQYFQPELSPEYLKFFASSFDNSMRVWNEFFVNIVSPPLTGTTEDSFHAFWDALIVKPVVIGCPDGVYNRNTSRHTSTGLFRPDTSYLLNGACLMRGEEKGPENTEDPAEELVSKLKWSYGDCPYIFGYYATASSVTYCYLYHEENRIKRNDLITCSLKNLEGRMKSFFTGINIGRLLHLLRQNIPATFKEEFVTIHRLDKIIKLEDNEVFVYYSSADPIMYLKSLYEKISVIPFIELLERIDLNKNMVVFRPKGVKYRPRTKKQLIKALCCVLTALKALHKIEIMHRDLRWENVLRYVDREIWFIIDFDDACKYPSTSNTRFDKHSHAPEISKDGHDDSVDVWSVGYLILTASVKLRKDDELRVYAEQSLMADDEFSRPSSEDALSWLWDSYEDDLREDFIKT